MDYPGSVTIIVEAKPALDTSVSAQDYVISLNNGLGGSESFFMTINQFQTNLYRFRYLAPGGTFKSIVASAPNIEDNYYVLMAAMNFGIAVDDFRAWINTTLAGTTAAGAATGVLDPVNTKIGISGTTSSPFGGHIRNFIVGRSHELKTSEQATLYNAITAGTLSTTDLDDVFGADNWVWWPLTEYSDTPTVHLGTLRDIELTGADSVELGKDKDITT